MTSEAYSPLPPSCLSLANTASTLRSSRRLLAGLRFGLRLCLRRGGDGSGQQRRALRFDRHRLFLGRLLHFEVEIDLRAQPERHRIERRQIGRIPVGALADRVDGRLGGADQPHDLAVLEFGMIAHQPEDGVRPVLAARHRRVARALLRLGFGQAHFRLGDVQLIVRVGFGGGDFLAGQLPGEDRIEPLDALRGVAVGDRLHFERMQVAQLRDLVERQRRILDQPHGCRFRHQGRGRHSKSPLRSARPAGRSHLRHRG